MEPDQIVPGHHHQVPDENYIERLFPKCPPKQQAAKLAAAAGSLNRRSLNLDRRRNDRPPQQPGVASVSAAPAATTTTTRRQTRSKQHSRRELAARRNQSSSSSSATTLDRLKQADEITSNNGIRGNLNVNKNNITIKNNTNNIDNNVNSTESSDDNRKSSRSRLKRSISSGQQPSSSSGLKHQQNPPSGSPIAPSSSSSGSTLTSARKSGKYTASQSLLQRLERSQSTYNNSNNVATSNTTTTAAQPTIPSGGQSRLQASKAGQQQQQPVSRVSGIVKSSSSFAFANESTITTNNQLPAASSSSSSVNSSMIMHPQHHARGTSHHQSEIIGSADKNDNSHSDLLFDHTNDQHQSVGNTQKQASVATCKSILRNSTNSHHPTRRDGNLRATRFIDEPAAATANMSDFNANSAAIDGGRNNLTEMESSKSEPLNSLLSKIDKRNSRCRSMASYNVESSEPSDSVPMMMDEAEAAADCVDQYALSTMADSNLTATAALKTTTTSAVSAASQDNKINSIARHLPTERKSAATPDENDQTILLIDTATTITNNQADKNKGSDTREGCCLNEPIENDLSRQFKDKDDDKYINLFVYDSATNQTLERGQILSSLSPPLERLHQQPNNNVGQQIKAGNKYLQQQTDDKILNIDDDKASAVASDQPAYLGPTGTVAKIIETDDEELEGRLSQSPANSSIIRQQPQQAHLPTGNFSGNTDSNSDSNCIVTVQHRESQQLLATDLNDDSDGANLVRNDASTEELCSIGDSSNRTLKTSTTSHSNELLEHLDTTQQNLSNVSSNCVRLSSHRASSLQAVVGILQTVDESAEINPIEEPIVDKRAPQAIDDKTTTTISPVSDEPTNEAMPANHQPNLVTKRAFVPPGYPQRIRPQQPVDISPPPNHQAPPTTNGSGSLLEISSNARDSTTGGQAPSVSLDKQLVNILDTDIIVQRDIAPSTTIKTNNNADSSSSSSKIDGPRVKFNDENLVIVSEDEHLSSFRRPDCLVNSDFKQHSTLAALLPSTPSAKRPPELSMVQQHQHQPKINEAIHEPPIAAASELVPTKKLDMTTIGSPERDLSAGVNKISLANSYSGSEMDRFETTGEDARSFKNTSQENYLNQHHRNHQTDQPGEISQQHNTESPLVPNLQHHKLPNETSHYSIVRSTIATDNSGVPTRSSSFQFNTLSDGESGLDDGADIGGGQVNNHNTNSSMMLTGSTRRTSYECTLMAKKCDPSLASGGGSGSSGSHRNLSMIAGLDQQQQPPKAGDNCLNNNNDDDDDLMPTTKTALIFPRLDEGLSSEAESGEDEIEDDDECAVDADVEADDDDDDEDDVDDDEDDEDEDDDDEEDDEDEDEMDEDDAENVTQLAIDGVRVTQSLQAGNSVDCFLRSQQQQHQVKQPNRLINSLQQQQQQTHGAPLAVGLNQADPAAANLQHHKGPGSAYGVGYMNHQDQASPIDHNDLKSMATNHSNQNGQSSNYWMSLASQQQQQANLSPQTNSNNQQFNQRIASHHNNINSGGGSNNISNPISKQNNRDEAKATNRLSSDTDNETDRLLGSQRNDQLKALSAAANSGDNGVINSGSGNNVSSASSDLQPGGSNSSSSSATNKQNASSKEVLIEGVLFNVKYLGSTHSDCEGRSEKEDRINQAEMAVQEVKFRNGDSQSATEVQLFISTEKIIVLEDKHRQIMMDHSLRTISYIADIGDAIVLIVRKKTSSSEATNELGRPISKISCHVFESRESHTITKAISHAFQVAYAELLKANGGDSVNYLHRNNDTSIPPDYQEVLNSQEMSTDELEMFSRQDNQRQVFVPKDKGEILGLSIVESGWGSVLPTVVIANLKQDGPAYRCKRLSVGDQIIKVGGISLVGLPLAECQEILRKTKNQTNVIFSVVPCPITVEVKIKRPDTKYQLGFSVQNGVICSLLRGGIAERGGVRVGHRIMSINGTTVVGVPHEKIVTLLASSVGEIRMKTCLTSLYRLMLGEENPVHF